LLRNIRFTGGAPLDTLSVQAVIRDGERRLGANGRLLVRKSGTERLIRIMAEGEDETLIGEIVDEIAAAVMAQGLAEEHAAE
jgi:phosphoglucosamine mutase